MDLTWHSEIDPALVREFLLAVMAVDGRPEVTPDGPLPREFRGGRQLVAAEGDRLLGYAHLDTDAFGRTVAELLVRPDARDRGLGAALVEEVRAQAPDARFWAHGDHPAAARIAERLGLSKVREMWQMRLEFAEPLPAPVWPPGISVRAFVPGQDEDAVVAVNKRAFDWHPEQGALTAADVVATEAEPWFDPAGLFLAIDAADSADRVVGFHWTKTHPDGVGEVYVVGVDPAAQGGGLGRALTLVGLAHLREQGRPAVILYVEADNAAAVAVYRRLGFTRSDADVQYAAGPPNDR